MSLSAATHDMFSLYVRFLWLFCPLYHKRSSTHNSKDASLPASVLSVCVFCLLIIFPYIWCQLVYIVKPQSMKSLYLKHLDFSTFSHIQSPQASAIPPWDLHGTEGFWSFFPCDYISPQRSHRLHLLPYQASPPPCPSHL